MLSATVRSRWNTRTLPALNVQTNDFIPFVPDYWELSEGDEGEAPHRGGSGTFDQQIWVFG